jgi:hypothetical protein
VKEKDRTKVSFAEAEGKARFPAVLEWGQVDQRIRAALWNAMYISFDKHLEYDSFADHKDHSLREPLYSIMFREFVHRRHQFVHDYEVNFYKSDFLKEWSNFFKNSDYVDLFDFVTFIVRDPDCPKVLIRDFAESLDKPFSPYRLSVDAKTIFPAVEEQQTDALLRDIGEAFSSPFSGSKSHIQTALQSLGDGDYRATVRESIHAVESAVRDFTGDPSAVLSKALKTLVGDLGVHRALSEAFDKLYAYSSDEKGIRHALVFGDNEKVGLDEAVFFVSSCTAFVGYLSRKKLGKQPSNGKKAGRSA